MWSRHAEDQPLLRRLEIAGDLPAPDVDGLAVVSTNAGANKLDAYLRRSIGYDAIVDEDTGQIQAAVTIRLANDAPTGPPADAGGNPFGLPPGTNRQYVSVYSPWELTPAELDGRPGDGARARARLERVLAMSTSRRAARSNSVWGSPGSCQTASEYGLLLRSQAMVVPDVVGIDVTTTDGRRVMSSHQPREGVVLLRPGPEREGS